MFDISLISNKILTYSFKFLLHMKKSPILLLKPSQRIGGIYFTGTDWRNLFHWSGLEEFISLEQMAKCEGMRETLE